MLSLEKGQYEGAVNGAALGSEEETAVGNAGASDSGPKGVSSPQDAPIENEKVPATMLEKWLTMTMRASIEWKDNHAAELRWEQEPSVEQVVA
jgi:hypothetical protein